ncbi:MAG: Trk system potassium transporter TrkA [Bacteroidetes bacterium SB0662_bin_6]|nr:Trk system potassium transporter TrkA [Bacteroidetes bacterium SB0668_bin_1]MYE04393.1 Trk system potassium transporter TrkA [Bacteroidetes bacterium SB0662_bin_6]
MRIIVVGAGEVGYDVARMLSREEHDVVVIDQDADAIRQVHEKLDVMVIVGNGTSSEVLDEAGITRADMLIAVTPVDEVNIIACMLADRLGVSTTIARVRSDEITRAQSVLKTSDFGIDLVIHPEESAANEVVWLVRRASATDILDFADGRLQLMGLRIDPDAPVAGKKLQDIAAAHSHVQFRVMGISRGARTIIPGGSDTLRQGDQVFVLALPKYMGYISAMMGKAETRANHIMILGGTAVGVGVASQFGCEKNKTVKLVEPNKERAAKLAEILKNVLVIHGAATDIDLLVQEGLGEMDAFVAVTDDEESNLVTCLMAKHLGVRKTVALLSKNTYIPISQSIGLDAAVSKKLAVSREIHRYLRGTHVRSVATIHGLDAQIVEIEAKPRSWISQKPLRELQLLSGALIGAVLHEGEVFIATGDTHITAGDQAIVFAMPSRMDDIERKFAAKS